MFAPSIHLPLRSHGVTQKLTPNRPSSLPRAALAAAPYMEQTSPPAPAPAVLVLRTCFSQVPGGLPLIFF